MGFATEIGLPVALAIIMFSMGLTLRPADFARIAEAPRLFALGAFSQMVILPAVAFVLVFSWDNWFGMNPAIAVGFLILAACPGGVTSNFLTHVARGDTALSITLTAVISLLAVLWVPLIVNFALSEFMSAEEVSLPLGQTVIEIFLITTVPVLTGMILNHFRPALVDRIENSVMRLATVLFCIVVAGAVAAEWNLLVTHFSEVGPPVLILNVLMLAIGFGWALLFRLSRPQAIAISLETGLQNATLAIFVGATLLRNDEMIVPGGVYGLVMLATAGGLVLFLRREAAPAKAETSVNPSK
ncbi:MAG: bile acid:sodium symporter family protein [Hyphomicrobiales bacterium]|nr:bile acid:sodium symporter family protein [Hyphomicrobiales bacterium]